MNAPARPWLLMFFVMTTMAWPEDWTRFRGPNGQGISRDKGFPVEFDRAKNMVWRTAVRPGKSSPVLTERHVFVSGFAGQLLYTQCFDRRTGKLLWERSVAVSHKDGMNLLNHPAASTPVTDGRNVYVFFKDSGLVSYDAGGRLRWRVEMGPFRNSQGMGASPILAGPLVVVQADQLEGSFLAAYSAADGKLRWKVAREESESWSTPILYRGRGTGLQILTAGASRLGGHAAGDGRRTFTMAEASPSMVASPVLAGDILYAFGYGFAAGPPFARYLERSDRNKDGVLSPDEYGTVNVFRAVGQYIGNRDGVVTEQEWKAWNDVVKGRTGLAAVDLAPVAVSPRLLWRYEKGFESVIPSPLLYEGVLYSVKNGGILTSFDVKSGEVLKTGRLEGAPGGYSASPVLAEGRLYLAGEEGKVAVVRAGRQWELERLNDLGEGIWASPALSGGRMFVRTEEALYCLGREVNREK